MYPILWAMKHAPCADVYEQAVLIQMADASDEDGCNSYLAVPTIADRIAGDIDPKTVRRKQDAMAKRGLLRPDTTPPPPRYLKIPKNRRPKRWELCIPHSWWSDAQREAVQRGREDRGLPPITPENRPDLAPAPPKTVRSDKGKERPERRKKSDWGDSQSPQLPEPGGTLSPPQGGLSVPPRGDSQSPNPPYDTPPVPSSPPAPPAPGERPAAADGGGRPGREEDDSAKETTGGAAPSAGALHGALALVDDAVARWGSTHRAPGARDRLRLAERVAAELAGGGTEETILDELTRDLGTAHSAVRVVLGARTATPGWGRRTDPRPDHARHEPSGPRPAWCGRCDERTRQLVVRAADGSERMARCDRCHPQADPAAEWGAAADEGQEEAAAAEVDPIELERMRASLNGTPAPRGCEGQDDDGLSPTARAAAEEVRRRLAALRTA